MQICNRNSESRYSFTQGYQERSLKPEVAYSEKIEQITAEGPMKILALHGLGSSGQMLREQLAPFVKQLGPNYQFKFLDGAIDCGRGPGIHSYLALLRALL